MANPYSSNPQWDQSQIYYNGQQQNVPLNSEFTFNGQYSEPRQQQPGPQQVPQHRQQQLPPFSNRYQPYSQPAADSGISQNISSLQGALHSNQHSRSASYGAGSAQPPPNSSYGSSYGSGNPPGQVMNQASYRNNVQPFTFESSHVRAGTVPSLTSADVPTTGGGLLTTSPDALHANFGQDSHHRLYPSSIQSNLSAPSSSKRQRSEPQEESSFDDNEPEHGQFEAKDNSKAKPIRACARCKTLKVKCEVKIEGDPCKRCLTGGHECIIPGRKVRRVPPKREHLISKIQAQAQEIERLMQQLESVTSVKKEEGTPTPGSSSPVLTTSTKALFGRDNEARSEDPPNAATKKAIEDWIAKTRENMQELSFIWVSSGGVPESYIVDEDFEDPYSSGDDEFVEASDRFEDSGDGDEYIEVAVEDPEGGALSPPDSTQTRKIRHQSSTSSMGTTKSAAGNRKKAPGDHAKPVNLPVEASPFGLFGKMSLKSQPRSRGPSVNGDEDEDDRGSGIANQNFFRPSPAPDVLVNRSPTIPQHQVPAILDKGIISPAEAEKLFQIYYEEMNLSVSLLDPILYDAKRTFWRSPFLFTVICAVASRFYSERPELYQRAMHYAQIAAGNALISGTKNVEMCAAYILMSLYPIPVKRWEHQRSWLYLGLAIRTATDLNLHLPITAKPKNENHAREMLNRTRIWLNCFNLDRSTGSQYGKPPIISNLDYTANHSENWWQSSPQNLQHFDIHICAYNAELRLMSNFMGKIYSDPHHPTGLNKEVDFESIATETDDSLQKLQNKWFSILNNTDMTDSQNRFRTGLLTLAYSYSRLIALSYGFQHAFGKTDGQNENPFLMRCLNAACDVVNAVNEICRPEDRHYWRHGPDAQSVFVTFAAAFLVKLLQPKFASYLSRDHRVKIRSLVQGVIDLMASPEIAVDDRHGPKLYSRFLKNLLAKPLARIDPATPGSTSTEPVSPKPRVKPTKTASGGDSMDSQPTYDPYAFNHPSPSTTGSLSPPPAESLTDFNNFRPVGGIDPYAPDAPIMNVYDAATGTSDMLMSDYFQPELPFDQDIIRSFHDLADPSGWQDISMPVGFNLATQFQQFQQNLGIDLRSINNLNIDPNMNYLTQ